MTSCGPIPVDLQLAADELLQAAIMGEMPLVIVEGFDDIRLYMSFAKQVNLECEVIASENILTEKPGCDGVIDNIEVIEAAAGNFDISAHVLGVIDRDARSFRNSIPASKALLILNVYSIESHFVVEETVRRILGSVLNVSEDVIAEVNTSELFDGVVDRLMGVYTVSLEALKNACVSGYKGEIGYGDKIRSVFLSGALPRINAKSSELHAFATQKNISQCWSDLRIICKGKWLLDLFCDYLHESIAGLPRMCASGHVPKCQYCAAGTNSKCLYRWRENFNSSFLKGIARGYVDLPEFDYIRVRMQTLA